MDAKLKAEEMLKQLDAKAAGHGYRIIIDRDKDEDGDDDEVYLVQQLISGDWETLSDYNSLEAAAQVLTDEFFLKAEVSEQIRIEAVVRDRLLAMQDKSAEDAAASLADVMKSGYGVTTVDEEEQKRIAELRAKAIAVAKEHAKEMEAAAKSQVEEAAARLRGTAQIIAEIGEKLEASGLMGHLTKPMQTFIKNMREVERDFAAAIGAPGAAPAPDEEEVPEMLRDFLKRSDEEKAARIAKEEAEAEAKRKAEAAAAAARMTTGIRVDHDYPDSKPDPAFEEEERRIAEEQKKIDELFGESIF